MWLAAPEGVWTDVLTEDELRALYTYIESIPPKSLLSRAPIVTARCALKKHHPQ